MLFHSLKSREKGAFKGQSKERKAKSEQDVWTEMLKY